MRWDRRYRNEDRKAGSTYYDWWTFEAGQASLDSDDEVEDELTVTVTVTVFSW